MKSSAIIIAIISLIAIGAFFSYLVFAIPLPEEPNEVIITKRATIKWNLETEQTTYGKTIWGNFNDNEEKAIKLYYCTYTGSLFHSFEVMGWENESDIYSTNSLNLDNLLDRWQDSASAFKFNYENEDYRISFSIPKFEDGTDKYSDLSEAWEEGELYQIVEEW